MDPQDDDDVEFTSGAYENGHWVWDEIKNELMFIRDAITTPDIPMTTAILRAVEFKEDVDLNEQQRFRKRMQRKAIGKEDIVTLQDIKDVVLFTAPLKIVKPSMIHLLHQRATERFFRALIFFCQYYLQISELLVIRKLEQQTKVRTALSDITEMEFRDNLEDLRLLVAKEYANIIIGAGEFAKYHHMGRQKKSRSLANKDSLLFETFLRITIQIIWIALGRKSFTQIEIEVNRLFKSPIFNTAEHRELAKDGTLNKISNTERSVLLGQCMVKKRHMVNMLSPLMSEVLCTNKDIDHRMFGLGFIHYPELNKRLKYMEYAVSLPEHLLERKGISLGILGLKRSRFDILLREIKFITNTSVSNVSIPKPPSKAGSSKLSKKKSAVTGPLYADVIIPPKGPQQVLMEEFPTEVIRQRKLDLVQQQKWLQRIDRLLSKRKSMVDIPMEDSRLLKFIN